MPRPDYNAELRGKVRRLYVDEGLSVRAVADAVDRSPPRVYALLKEMDVELRSPHEWSPEKAARRAERRGEIV